MPALVVVALCICAFTSISSVSGLFAQALLDQSRAGLGADLSIEAAAPPTTEQRQYLDALTLAGGDWTTVSLSVAITASTRDRAVLAVLKNVDPEHYPYYGAVELSPPLTLPEALEQGAVVSQVLAQYLELQVGDMLTVNGLSQRVSAVIQYEPDRFAGNFSAARRVLLDSSFVDWVSLAGDFPRLQRILVRVPATAETAVVQADLRDIFPAAEIFRLEDVNPIGANAVSSASEVFTIAAWLALALGALGVFMIGRLHLEWREETISTLKSLGATPRAVAGWLTMEQLLVGALGGAIGAVAGLAASWILPALAGIEGTASTDLRSGTFTLLAGVALGALLAPGAMLLWLFAHAEQRPLDHLDASRQKRTIHPRSWGLLVVTMMAGGILAAFSALRPGVAIFLALLIGGGLLHISSQGMLWLLRRTPALLELKSPYWKQSVRNLLLPERGNPTLVTALAAVALLVSATAVGSQIVGRAILKGLPFGDANVYLMGFPQEQLQEVQQALNETDGIEQPYRIVNLAWRRVLPEGLSAEQVRLLPMQLVNCEDSLSAGSGAILSTDLASRLGKVPGDTIFLETGGELLPFSVAMVREVPVGERAWFDVTVPCESLDKSSLFHAGSVRTQEHAARKTLEILRDRFPVMGIAEPDTVFEEITRILQLSSSLIRFLAVMMILAGIVILSGLIAAAARQRSGEIAVYRMLGATRSTVARRALAEFALLGLYAGALGGIAGVALANFGLSVILQIPVAEPQWGALGIAILSGTLIASSVGWAMSRRYWQERPLATLRRF